MEFRHHKVVNNIDFSFFISLALNSQENKD